MQSYSSSDPLLSTGDQYELYIELTEITDLATLAESVRPAEAAFGYTPPPLGLVFTS